MPRMEIRGCGVEWREAGTEHDATPVILAHCSLAHSGLWKPIIAELAQSRPVVALDMPAHGRTDPPPEGESLQLFAAEICERLIERLGGRAHMVGLSLGGATLARLAVRRPELGASLTMIEPVLFHLLTEPGEERPAPEAFREGEDPKEALIKFMGTWGAPGGYERMDEKGREYALRVFPHLRRDTRMIGGWPEGQIDAGDLARLPMPVMLVGGEKSPPSGLEVLDVIAQAIPSARRRSIPGAGHLSPVTHWKEVLAELEDFFAAAEAAPAARAAAS